MKLPKIDKSKINFKGIGGVIKRSWGRIRCLGEGGHIFKESQVKNMVTCERCGKGYFKEKKIDLVTQFANIQKQYPNEMIACDGCQVEFPLKVMEQLRDEVIEMGFSMAGQTAYLVVCSDCKIETMVAQQERKRKIKNLQKKWRDKK